MENKLIHLSETVMERRARTGSKTCTTAHAVCDTGDAHAVTTHVKKQVTCSKCRDIAFIWK